MKHMTFAATSMVALLAGLALADDAPVVGEPLFDPPTLHCIGVRWFVADATHPKATVAVEYRKKGAPEWRKAMPLRPVETAALQQRKPADGVALYAGSIFHLSPDTEYEVRLTLRDANAGQLVRTETLRTWKEPTPPTPKRTIHVTPGDGGGSGSADDPFAGLAAADEAARPGDVILVHKGTYDGPVSLKRSGTPQAPIVWRGAGDGEAVIKGPAKRFALAAQGRRYLFFEDLSFVDAGFALVLHGASNVTVRRCRFGNVSYGIVAHGPAQRLFICDSTLVGTQKEWPQTGEKIERRGIEVSGIGHVIAYNRISGFRDGVDTRPPYPVRGIDIHNNEISECSDDGIELDYSESNCRAFSNRITNALMGISFQPSRGGPNYAVRNVLVNIGLESYKLHLSPARPGHMTSGGVLLHNTVVKKGPAVRVWSNEGPARYFYARNNLYVTADAANAIEITCPMEHADFDHNVYACDKPLRDFAYWNKTRYNTIADFAAKAGQEEHGRLVASIEGIFAGPLKPPGDANSKLAVRVGDVRLAADGPAIDAGQVLPNVNDGHNGHAPDAGAVEFGDSQPHYGPRAK